MTLIIDFSQEQTAALAAKARAQGLSAEQSLQCNPCPERATCGGGYMPHCYARANGFDNPSVWCADIFKLIGHIRDCVGYAATA